VERQLAEEGVRPNSLEGYNQAEWVLLDYVDFVVHIFSERARRFYDLERLWKSARRLRPADLARKTARPAAKKTVRKSARARPAGSGQKRASTSMAKRRGRGGKTGKRAKNSRRKME
jgi:ribosome-associated protein